MKDDAGNLLFTHNGKEYRILKFNWRLQRKFLGLLASVQADGQTLLFGEDAEIVQDKIFAHTQVKTGSDQYQFIDADFADSFFENFKESSELYTKIIQEIEPFLSEGSESSQVNSASQKTEGTIKKPRPTSRK